jgi:arylsulfatase A-like enzyme/Flp pilus assembly protein TadD
MLWRERALRSAPRPLEVLLITLDTTRADRLGCYGYEKETSPNLDVLARQGVLFRRAYSHVPLTCPSHASMFTGLTPARHGVHDNGGFVLGESFPTLAEAFTQAGYRTGAFVSAFVLERRFGLARGFATYEDDVVRGGEARKDQVLASVRAEVKVDRAIEWLRLDDPRPVFAWVHLYDPHDPYEAPEPFRSRFPGRPYDAEVAYMDSQIGRLLAAFAERNRARPALVAAVGDHGESLGEHGESTHSYFIYEATQRVPLMLSFPGHLPRGVEVDTLVRGVDVMPTLLDIAGLPIPPDVDGRSLVPLMTGRSRTEAGPAYLESYHPRLWWGAQELLGLRSGRWLYVRSPRPELYEVEVDPAESRNVAAHHPVELQALDARLQGMMARTEAGAGRAAIDPEAAARLQALGYVTGAPQAADADLGTLPDAKDNAPLLRSFTEAHQLEQKGRLEEALAAYRDTLRLNPRSAVIRSSIAGLLLKLGRYPESFAAYQELYLEFPKWEGYTIGMSESLFREGRKLESLALLRSALELSPSSTPLHENAGAVLASLGRLAESEAEFRRAVDLSPRQLKPRLRLARVLTRLRRDRQAADALRAVVRESPNSEEGKQAGDGLVALAGRLFDSGQLEEARKAYEASREAGVLGEEVYMNLALTYYRLGRRGESLNVLREGCLKVPGSATLHYRTGRLLQELAMGADAEREYRKALELDPARNDARLALASLLASSARDGEAEALYLEVSRASPGSKEAAAARQALSGLRAR